MLLSLFFISLAFVLSSSAEPINEDVPPKSILLDNPSWTILIVTVDTTSKQNADLSKGVFYQ